MATGVTQSILYEEIVQLRERLDAIEEKLDKVVGFVNIVESTLEQMGPVMEKIAPLMQMLNGPGEMPSTMEGVNVLGKSHD